MIVNKTDQTITLHTIQKKCMSDVGNGGGPLVIPPRAWQSWVLEEDDNFYHNCENVSKCALWMDYENNRAIKFVRGKFSYGVNDWGTSMRVDDSELSHMKVTVTYSKGHCSNYGIDLSKEAFCPSSNINQKQYRWDPKDICKDAGIGEVKIIYEEE